MQQQPQKILIIQTAFLGDVILATSLLETLHACFPKSEIDFLVRKDNESLLKNHPFLHQVLIWDKTRNKHLNLFRMGTYVKKQCYDVVVNLQRFASTGWLTYYAGANINIGFSQNPFSRFFTSKVLFSTSNDLHETERNHQLIADLVGNMACRKPKLYPSKSDFESVLHFQKTAHDKYICIAPASVWFTKQLPESKWIEFVSQVPDSYYIYVLGSKQDLKLCNSIANNVKRKNLLNLAGRLSLLQSAALMQGASMNYMNDSAPMHLCSAVNAPTCAIFCSTVPSFGFGPLADQRTVIETTIPLPCKPCGLHGYKACPEGHFKCGYTIDTKEMVLILPKEK